MRIKETEKLQEINYSKILRDYAYTVGNQNRYVKVSKRLTTPVKVESLEEPITNVVIYRKNIRTQLWFEDIFGNSTTMNKLSKEEIRSIVMHLGGKHVLT